jgi:hypothetical protein
MPKQNKHRTLFTNYFHQEDTENPSNPKQRKINADKMLKLKDEHSPENRLGDRETMVITTITTKKNNKTSGTMRQRKWLTLASLRTN